MSTLNLVMRSGADGLELVSPDAGMFTCALPRGAAVSAGQSAGTLLVLGRAHSLVVPAGVNGRVSEERPERVHEPVGAGQVLYRIAPFADGGEALAVEEEASTSGLIVSAAQSGRFYHRPAPGEPAFLEVGSEVSPGTPIGLVEVMKTFARIPYAAQGGLPERARVVRLIAGDGDEIQRGDPLLEVEPA